MRKRRRNFDTSRKLEVVRMVREQGSSVKQVSDSAYIGETAVRRWLKQYFAEQSGQKGIGNSLTVDHGRAGYPPTVNRAPAITWRCRHMHHVDPSFRSAVCLGRSHTWPSRAHHCSIVHIFKR
ncbi:transposase [Actimicrobium antarcticum]|uniref:transposase n=1 Tax=Actimicrobium antarcticum TaxID=1051899 RepID=UPI003CD081D5